MKYSKHLLTEDMLQFCLTEFIRIKKKTKTKPRLWSEIETCRRFTPRFCERKSYLPSTEKENQPLQRVCFLVDKQTPKTDPAFMVTENGLTRTLQEAAEIFWGCNMVS